MRHFAPGIGSPGRRDRGRPGGSAGLCRRENLPALPVAVGFANRETRDKLVGPDAGWSSLVARRAHNPKVAGSNPAPAMEIWPEFPDRPLGGRVFSASGTSSGVIVAASS